MRIPAAEQYVELKTHLRYLNDKIIEAFSRFITLAIAIVGGVLYIHITLPLSDPRRNGLRLPSNAIFSLIGIGTIVIILQTLFAWMKYRKTLSEFYPAIREEKSIRTWIGEICMCIIIVVSIIVFWIANPLL